MCICVLSRVVQTEHSLEEIRERLQAAVRGALGADAATMPLHWIYSEKEIRELVGSSDPSFHSPPATKFYQKALGELSVYGDELQPLIDALVNEDGMCHFMCLLILCFVERDRDIFKPLTELKQPNLHQRYYDWLLQFKHSYLAQF